MNKYAQLYLNHLGSKLPSKKVAGIATATEDVLSKIQPFLKQLKGQAGTAIDRVTNDIHVPASLTAGGLVGAGAGAMSGNSDDSLRGRLLKILGGGVAGVGSILGARRLMPLADKSFDGAQKLMNLQ